MSRLALVTLLFAMALAGCAEKDTASAWHSDCVAAGHTPETPEFADCLKTRQAQFEEECLSAVAACQ